MTEIPKSYFSIKVETLNENIQVIYLPIMG